MKENQASPPWASSQLQQYKHLQNCNMLCQWADTHPTSKQSKKIKQTCLPIQHRNNRLSKIINKMKRNLTSRLNRRSHGDWRWKVNVPSSSSSNLPSRSKLQKDFFLCIFFGCCGGGGMGFFILDWWSLVQSCVFFMRVLSSRVKTR